MMKEAMNKTLKTNISNTFVNDVCSIIEKGRQQAYTAINASMIETYWKIGKRIVEEEQCGNERAEYGQRIIEHLSQELTKRYGKGFSKRYLAYFPKILSHNRQLANFANVFAKSYMVAYSNSLAGRISCQHPLVSANGIHGNVERTYLGPEYQHAIF